MIKLVHRITQQYTKCKIAQDVWIDSLWYKEHVRITWLPFSFNGLVNGGIRNRIACLQTIRVCSSESQVQLLEAPTHARSKARSILDQRRAAAMSTTNECLGSEETPRAILKALNARSWKANYPLVGVQKGRSAPIN